MHRFIKNNLERKLDGVEWRVRDGVKEEVMEASVWSFGVVLEEVVRIFAGEELAGDPKLETRERERGSRSILKTCLSFAYRRHVDVGNPGLTIGPRHRSPGSALHRESEVT